jgi:hypothetical protein
VKCRAKTKATIAGTRILLNYDQTSEITLRKDAKMSTILIKNRARSNEIEKSIAYIYIVHSVISYFQKSDGVLN